MTVGKELPIGLGKLIVIQKYFGKTLDKPLAAFCLGEDIFGSMWLEANSETPRTFTGSRIDEWTPGSVSADDATTDIVSGDETRVAFLIDRFSDVASFYRLSPPFGDIEYVVLTRSSGRHYIYVTDSMSYASNNRPMLINGEFETNEDALKALGYLEAPTK